MEKEILPNFNVVPPSQFDPAVFTQLDPKDELGGLICSLAMVYNDVKDMAYFSDFITTAINDNDSREEKYRASFHQIGQLRGMSWFVSKMFVGIIHEFFFLLRTKQEVIRSQDFQVLLKKLTKDKRSTKRYVNEWRALFKFACGETDTLVGDRRLSNMLLRIRSNISFHYNQTNETISSYCYQVGKCGHKEEGKFLYASLGNSMEQSRFYFADAIVEGYIGEKLEGFYDTFDELQRDFLPKMNATIRFIVEKYLKKRSHSLSKD